MGPEALAQVLCRLPLSRDPYFLNRDQRFSDAGIYQISEQTALVQTVDFFTPVVDDPYLFGQIAAANALSDIYATGGRPVTALNIICFPCHKLPLEVMAEILRGGADKVQEAGAVVVGGHSIEDNEPKYGLAVTGLISTGRLKLKEKARPGDCLVLTKPLGTGILTTALKAGVVAEPEIAEALEGMSALNAAAAEALTEVNVSACTDITGFGLLGHLQEMVVSAGVGACLDINSIPYYPKTLELADQGFIPAGAYRNRDYYRPSVLVEEETLWEQLLLLLLADPQTSGGLLMAVDPGDLSKLLASLSKKRVNAQYLGKITGQPKGKITLV